MTLFLFLVGVLLGGRLPGTPSEKLLCSFEQPEIDQIAQWAFRTKKVSERLYEIEPEQYGGVRWHIARGEATHGEWAYADTIEGPAWRGYGEGDGERYAGRRPHDKTFTYQAYRAAGADNFNTWFLHWKRRAFPAPWFPVDWSAYDFLRVDVRSDRGDVKMWVCLEDDEIEPYLKRSFQFPAGKWFTLEVDLRRAATERGLDLKKMRNLWTFVWETSAPTTVLMDNLRLATKDAPARPEVLRDETPMRLPGPPKPVPRQAIQLQPDHSPLKDEKPKTIDLAQRWPGAFAGFGNKGYRFQWRGGIAAFDNRHLALLLLGDGRRGVLVTSDGGDTWNGLDGTPAPTTFPCHAHAMGAAADTEGILMVASAGRGASCGGNAPTDRVWFRQLAFRGDRWQLSPETLVTSDPRHCPYTYSLLRLASGRIWVSWREEDRFNTWSLHLRLSDDGGATWLSWRPGKTPGVDTSDLISDCGTLAPCGDSTMCVYTRAARKGYSAQQAYFTTFDGETWSKPAPIEGSDGRVWSAANAGGKNVLVSLDSFGKGSILSWDGATWKKEFPKDASGGLLTMAGERVFLVALDRPQKELRLWERKAPGLWTDPRQLVSEPEPIETYSVPVSSPPNFAPVAWTSPQRKWVKLLRVPVESRP
jgi:hypothetical protein